MNTQPNWISAFQTAIEADPAQMPGKISQAKQAILDRIQELHGINADSERYELKTALQTLRQLTNDGRRGLRI